MIERIPVMIHRLKSLEDGQEEIKQMIADLGTGRARMWEVINTHSISIAKIQAGAHVLYLSILACGGLMGFLISIALRYAFVGH